LVEGTVMEGEEVYSVGEETEATFLGRPALDVGLIRDGIERVRLTVDVETGAVVRTRAYDGSSELYCDRRLLSFETGPVTLPDGAEAAGEQESTEPIPAAPERVFNSSTPTSRTDSVLLQRRVLLGRCCDRSRFNASFRQGDEYHTNGRDDGMAVVGDLHPISSQK
jgi:hypothetical protein